MVAEQKRAVGFAHDDPDKYPSEILAEARYFAGLVKSQTEKKKRKKVPTLHMLSVAPENRLMH